MARRPGFRRAATPANNRFHRVFEELAAAGIEAEAAVYADDFANEVREQLLTVDGVLVGVDPSRGRAVSGAQGKNGSRVDTPDDAALGDRCWVAPDYLRCRLSLWTAQRRRRGHLCSLRDQCEFCLGVPDQAPAAIARLTKERVTFE